MDYIPMDSLGFCDGSSMGQISVSYTANQRMYAGARCGGLEAIKDALAHGADVNALSQEQVP